MTSKTGNGRPGLGMPAIKLPDQKLLQRIAEVARSAAEGAGALIRERLGAPESVDAKAPRDYVTDVERRAEALIMAATQTILGRHLKPGVA